MILSDHEIAARVERERMIEPCQWITSRAPVRPWTTWTLS
jgi:hypothetical protein